MEPNKGHDVYLKKRIFSIPGVILLTVTIAFAMLFAFQLDLDWDRTASNIRQLDPWFYVAAFLSYYLSFIFRGLRWRLLAINANPLSEFSTRVPSALNCAQLIIIGWFVNSIAWMRIGDAYRAYGFAQDSGQSFYWSLGTVLAERVVDMLIILALLFVSIAIFTSNNFDAASRYILIASTIMAFTLLSIVVAMAVYGSRLARLMPHRIKNVYYRFHQGTVGSFKRIPLLIAIGSVGWLLEITRLYFVVLALDFNISLALVCVVALGHAILSTVPTPGGIGIVEPGITGLLLLGLTNENAVSVALVDRSITLLSVILVGGIVFLIRNIALAKRKRCNTMQPS